MKNFWSYISAFLGGIIVGVIIMVKKIKPVINQKVNKLKQRGENNEQNAKGEINFNKLSKKQERKLNKLKRKIKKK